MKLMIFKLGSEDKGFIPSKKMFDEFRKALEEAMKTGDVKNVLLAHPFVRIQEVDVPDNARVVCLGDAMEDKDMGHVLDEKLEDMERRLRLNLEGNVQHIISQLPRPWYKKLFGRK